MIFFLLIFIIRISELESSFEFCSSHKNSDNLNLISLVLLHDLLHRFIAVLKWSKFGLCKLRILSGQQILLSEKSHPQAINDFRNEAGGKSQLFPPYYTIRKSLRILTFEKIVVIQGKNDRFKKTYPLFDIFLVFFKRLRLLLLIFWWREKAIGLISRSGLL